MMEPAYRENKEKQWNPYEMHGGTAIGIVGEDFAMIGSDTRLSVDYSIDCRKKSRIFQMNKNAMICATGFDGDVDAFISRMRNILTYYEQQHFHEMSVESIARCVANTLYSKRFFPYYINVLVAGVTKDGVGKLYGYDPVGTIEDLKCDTNGSGSALAAPILDSVFGHVHHNTRPFPYPTQDYAKTVIKDAIGSVAERDIYTGDCLQIATISADGFKIEEFSLPEH